jgi:hypothetical protein
MPQTRRNRIRGSIGVTGRWISKHDRTVTVAISTLVVLLSFAKDYANDQIRDAGASVFISRVTADFQQRLDDISRELSDARIDEGMREMQQKVNADPNMKERYEKVEDALPLLKLNPVIEENTRAITTLYTTVPEVHKKYENQFNSLLAHMNRMVTNEIKGGQSEFDFSMLSESSLLLAEMNQTAEQSEHRWHVVGKVVEGAFYGSLLLLVLMNVTLRILVSKHNLELDLP